MVGIKSYVLKQETPYLLVLMLKKMEINIDVLMSFILMKCGVHQTSEECIQCLKEKVI